ncbi:MAG: pyridoxamine 5'-phosphate oxidase family protein, partial [Bacteroidota bacterium]
MLGELNEEQMDQVLTNNLVGRIGCYADEKMYVVPVTYLYTEGCLLGHTIIGMKTKMLKKNPKCCFEVDNLQNIA